MAKGFWRVDRGNGNGFIVRAQRRESARAYAKREFGNDGGPYRVNKATDADLEWYEAMGGRIHDA